MGEGLQLREGIYIYVRRQEQIVGDGEAVNPPRQTIASGMLKAAQQPKPPPHSTCPHHPPSLWAGGMAAQGRGTTQTRLRPGCECSAMTAELKRQATLPRDVGYSLLIPPLPRPHCVVRPCTSWACCPPAGGTLSNPSWGSLTGGL